MIRLRAAHPGRAAVRAAARRRKYRSHKVMHGQRCPASLFYFFKPKTGGVRNGQDH